MMHVGASRSGWVRSVASASEELTALNAAVVSSVHVMRLDLSLG